MKHPLGIAGHSLLSALASASAACAALTSSLGAQTQIFEVGVNSSFRFPVSTDQGVARVVGFSSTGTSLSVRMIEVNMLGTSASESGPQALGNGVGVVVTAISDGGGGAFIGGSGDMLFGTAGGGTNAWAARIDSDAQTVWGRDFTFGELTALASDGSGGVFAAGAVVAGQAQGFGWLARLDSNGADHPQFGVPILLPSSVLTGNSTTVTAVGDGSGNVLLAWQSADKMAYISRFSGSGSLDWIVPASSAAGVQIRVKSMSSDGAGGCWLGGGVVGLPFGGISSTFDDAWWMHVTSSGTIAFAKQFGSATQAYTLEAISADSDRVYVCHRLEGGGGADALHLSSMDPDGTNGSVVKDFWNPLPDVVVGIPTADPGGLMMLQSNVSQPATLTRYSLSPCVNALSYCSPSLTSVSGCGASLTTNGSPSVSAASGFDLDVTSIPAPGASLLLFSASPGSTPVFSGGTLCVQSFKRSGAKISNGTAGVCNGAVSFTLQDLIDADGATGAPLVAAGAHLYVQAWGRDPDNPHGQPFYFSDAAEILICP